MSGITPISPFPCVLFAASAAAVLLTLRKAGAMTTTPPKTVRVTVDGKKGHVSSRGAPNLALAMDYLADFFVCRGDPCHPVDNPRGHIPLAVAENRLVADLLQSRLSTLSTAQAGFDDRETYSYGNPQGWPAFRDALADLLQERFSQCQGNPKIRSKHIAVGAGAVQILSSTFFALGNPGDAVLVPAPYYAAFDNDLRAFAGCQTIPVVCQDPARGPSVQDLERAKLAAKGAGWNVRFLLLTNPNNPLGVVYQPQVLREAITWARSHSMDTVVDEIYALSVFDKKEEFTSVIEVCNNNLGNDVHLVWGLSKDFGASGFRIGVLYTQNELLMEAISNLIVFAWVSQPMQSMMTSLLNDKPFVNSFLEESCRRLKHSYNLCAQVLEELHIPFVPATAAMFLYLDLTELIQTKDEESTVGRILMKRARMVLTPGTTQHDPQPGKFRICYAYVSPEVLQIGMERFRKVVTKIRDQGGLGEWTDEDSHWQDIL